MQAIVQTFKKGHRILIFNAVKAFNKANQICFIDSVVVDKQTTAHNVKQHIGKVMVGAEPIFGHLQAIGGSYDTR